MESPSKPLFPTPISILPPQLQTPNPKKRKHREKSIPTHNFPHLPQSSQHPNDSTHMQLQVFPFPPPRKRNPSPGLRIRGARIYDSINGRTCHQCRQKTMDVAVSCKNPKYENGCGRSFCFRCIMNRYGESAEELRKISNWECPKCRNVCNCSFCMRDRGQRPFGMLLRSARKTGFHSVMEVLAINAPENVSPLQIKAPLRKEKASVENVVSNLQLKSLTSLSGGKRKEHSGDSMGESSGDTLKEFKRKVLGKKREFNRSQIKKNTKKARRTRKMYPNLAVNNENQNGMLDREESHSNVVVNEENVNGRVSRCEVPVEKVALNIVVDGESVTGIINGGVPLEEVPLDLVLDEEYLNRMGGCEKVRKANGARLKTIARSRRIRLKNLARAKKHINMLDNGTHTKERPEIAQCNELHLNGGENNETSQCLVMQASEENNTSEGGVIDVNEAKENCDRMVVEFAEGNTNEGVATEATGKEKANELMGANEELNLDELLVPMNEEQNINEQICEEVSKTRQAKMEFPSTVESEVNPNEGMVPMDEENDNNERVGSTEELPQMQINLSKLSSTGKPINVLDSGTGTERGPRKADLNRVTNVNLSESEKELPQMQINLNTLSSTENSVNVLDGGTGTEKGTRKADLSRLTHVNLSDSEKEEMIRLVDSVNRKLAQKDKQERDALRESLKLPVEIKSVKLNKLEWAKNKNFNEQYGSSILGIGSSPCSEGTDFQPICMFNPYSAVGEYESMNGRVDDGREMNENQLEHMQVSQRCASMCGVGAQSKNHEEVPHISVASSSNGIGNVEEMKPKESGVLKNVGLNLPDA